MFSFSDSRAWSDISTISMGTGNEDTSRCRILDAASGPSRENRGKYAQSAGEEGNGALGLELRSICEERNGAAHQGSGCCRLPTNQLRVLLLSPLTWLAILFLAATNPLKR